MRKVMVLILVSGFLSLAQAAKSKEKAGEVRKDVDKMIAEMESKMGKMKTPQEKLRLVSRTLGDVAQLRGKSLRQSEQDEIYMDLLVSAMGDFPKASRFKKSKCSSYKNNLLVNYEPTAEGVPEEPSIKKAYLLLEKICK